MGQAQLQPDTVMQLSDPKSRLAALKAKASRLVESSKADNTRRAYDSDWADFVTWCGEYGLTPMPATSETVQLYISDLESSRKPSTISRRLATIATRHKEGQCANPTRHYEVRETLRGIRATNGAAPSEKQPLSPDDIRAGFAKMRPGRLISVRDKCLLLLGFTGAFRRSEIVALNVDDLEFTADGVTVMVRRGKTDRFGLGAQVALPCGSDPVTDAVQALRTWLAVSGISEGAIFRSVNNRGELSDVRLSDRSVANIVKAFVKSIGKDERLYSGHSLRSGFATTAAFGNASERSIMQHGRWRTASTVRRYVRRGTLYTDNAAKQLGL